MLSGWPDTISSYRSWTRWSHGHEQTPPLDTGAGVSLNYYNRHIGDYAKDTTFLTLAQDGAYGRMLDWYYLKEKPLPLDRADLYEKMRAKSKADRDAVDKVLREFFHEEPDGWHKGRCDEEIERYQNKAEANRVNGASGGRPRKLNGSHQITQVVSENNPNHNPKITLANNQEPVASSQEPVANKKQSQERARATRLAADWKLPEEWKTWAIEAHHIDAKQAVRISIDFRDYWHAKSGSNATKLDWFATWRRWVRKETGNA